jgi:hypothetical protein
MLTPIYQFVGDIHQPLHDEELDVGGNTVDVTFGGESTNLHAIWDTNIPEKYQGGYALTDARDFATTLTTAIKTGTYKSKAAGWIDGLDITDAKTTSMSWASDSNAYVCSTVMPDGISVLESGDLDGAYYTSAIPVVKLQLAKAGYRYVTHIINHFHWILTASRLAAWLDAIAAAAS